MNVLWDCVEGDRRRGGMILPTLQSLQRRDIPEFLCALEGHQHLFQGHVYTDGSASHPHNAVLRRAAWAVVQLEPPLKTGGVLPHRHLTAYTVYEAELFALVWVVEHRFPHAPLTVHVDNAAVVSGAHHAEYVMLQHLHADLWRRFFAACRLPGQVTVVKIKAHQVCPLDPTLAIHWLKAW
eukprot:1057527-Amphidinium_carterae.2